MRKIYLVVGLLVVSLAAWYLYKDQIREVVSLHVFNSPLVDDKLFPLSEDELANLYTAAESVTNSNSTIVVDATTISGAPLLKSKFGVSNNIASIGLVESLETTYLDELGPGLFCTNVEFDQELKHGDAESLILPNPSLEVTTDADGIEHLSTKPTSWMTDFEKLIYNRNIPLLVQLSGAPPPYQVNKIEKPAEHPAPTDGPAFTNSSKLVAAWTDKNKHLLPIKWSVWHEPEHALTGIEPSRQIDGDYLPPYSETNPEPDELFEARDAQSRTDAITILVTLYRTYYGFMKQSLSPYSQYGLSGFLYSGFNKSKLTAAAPGRPVDMFFPSFLNHYTVQNKSTSVPIDFLSFDSYNGEWGSIVSESRLAIKDRTDIGPLIFNEYAPSVLKEETDLSSSELPLAATVEMLNDMMEVVRKPDIANFCMSYWVGGDTGILKRNKDEDPVTVSKTVRYAALKFYSELPLNRGTLTGDQLVDKQKSGLHGVVGSDMKRVGVMLWNNSALGSSPITTSLEFKNLPKNWGTRSVNASMKVIASNSDVEPVAVPYSVGQSIAVPPSSVVLITLELADQSVPNLLLRRNSLVAPVSFSKPKFLSSTITLDRTETDCRIKDDGSTNCVIPEFHYGSYDPFRSVASLGSAHAYEETAVTVTYAHLPDVLYLNALSAGAVSEDVVLGADITYPNCTKKIHVEIATTTKTQSLNLATAGSECKWSSNSKTANITFTMQDAAPHTQFNLYLSGSSREANMIGVAASK